MAMEQQTIVGSVRNGFQTTVIDRLPFSKRRSIQLIGIVVLALAWEAYGSTTSDLIFPQLSSVVVALWDLFVRTGNIYPVLGMSLEQLLVGYALAVLVALPVGVFMGTSDTAEYLLDSYVNVLFVTSVSSLLPFLIIILGIGVKYRIAVVFLFAVFHMILNFQAALENVDQELVNAGRVYDAKGTDLYRHVMIPAALPMIVAGFRMGIGRSVKGMVVAERWIYSGTGYLLHSYQQSLELDYVLAVIIVLMALGVFAVRGLYYLEDKFAPWQATELE